MALVFFEGLLQGSEQHVIPPQATSQRVCAKWDSLEDLSLGGTVARWGGDIKGIEFQRSWLCGHDLVSSIE